MMKFMRQVNKRSQRKHHRGDKLWISIIEPLQMIRMDIFGPINVMSTSSKDLFLRWLVTTLDRQVIVRTLEREDIKHGG